MMELRILIWQNFHESHKLYEHLCRNAEQQLMKIIFVKILEKSAYTEANTIC